MPFKINHMEKQPRVLVLSRDSWNTTNNSGNTLSNLFQNWNSDNIANIYCRDEIPNNDLCKKYFKISESSLLKKLRGKTAYAGEQHSELQIKKKNVENLVDFELEKREKKIYDFFRKNRWHVFLWMREILWKITPWKSPQLSKFVSDFKPDIIYSPSYDSFYMHSLLYHLHKISNAKIILFHCDDLVTFRQFSLSPIYWINRFILRTYMNKSILLANKNYCIIDEQAKIYKKIYNIPFELLYKTGNFETLPNLSKTHDILKFVYTGNIIYGRINTLIAISNALKEINKENKKAELFIYTANKISEKHRKRLLSSNSVNLMGKVDYEQIPNILQDASLLIHVESFERQQKLSTSLSFSTKIVDYFESGKPIFAVGWENAASIRYFYENKIGITSTGTSEIKSAIQKIIDDSSKLEKIGIETWNFGKKNHNNKDVLIKFQNQLIEVN